MITNENVSHFTAFGFLPLPGLLSRDETLLIREEIERVGHERSQVPDKDSKESGGIGDIAGLVERVRALMVDERLHDIPATILGHDFTYEGSDAQWHVGDTPWHGGSGVQQKQLASIKISFYLDDLDETNGCLRIIPGGHRNLLMCMDSRWIGVPDYLFPVRNRTLEEKLPWGISPQEVPHLSLPSRLGDACVFTEDIPHAAYETKGVRRQLSLSFMANPLADNQKNWVKQRNAMGNGPNLPRVFEESEDPRLRKMIEPLLELGLELS